MTPEGGSALQDTFLIANIISGRTSVPQALPSYIAASRCVGYFIWHTAFFFYNHAEAVLGILLPYIHSVSEMICMAMGAVRDVSRCISLWEALRAVSGDMRPSMSKLSKSRMAV